MFGLSSGISWIVVFLGNPGPQYEATRHNMNSRYELNKNLAQMLKGGVIMDVTTAEQARIAEDAGACAVMALERIPADIRAAGGVSRMSDPKMIRGIQKAVTIPVMDNPGRALSREDILNAVWGRDYFGELKIVDVNIRRLRIKIEDNSTIPTYITTVWGYGYKWGF